LARTARATLIASHFVAALAGRCGDGWAPACTLRPLGASVLTDAEARCATDEPYGCDTLATLLLFGYGVAADRDAAARLSDRTSYGVRVAIADAGGALLPIPLADPPEPVVASLSPADDGEPREGTFVGWDGSRSHYSVGLPALSADGRVVAVIRSDGDGTDGEVDLLSLDVESGAVGRTDRISESHASEEETEAEVAQWAATRRAISTVSRYLSRRGFRSLGRVPSPDEPAVAGAPILEWTSDGWVTLRDPSTGRVRYAERLVIPDPEPPADLDEEALEEWWIEHACDVPGLDDAAAWSIDATHVLVMTRVNPPPDECVTSTEHRIVTLAP
jgi:hypothetical protein